MFEKWYENAAFMLGSMDVEMIETLIDMVELATTIINQAVFH